MCRVLDMNKSWDFITRDPIMDLYFRIHCLYNAETELYDRSLTDGRDKYDPTSAYINTSYEVMRRSNSFASGLYQWCKSKIEYITRQPFDLKLWRDCAKGYEKLSAQGWVDLYERMKKGETI